MSLILEFDLVPRSSFFNNLRKYTTKENWDILRKRTYSKYKVTCGICKATNTVLDCHEIWEYDDINHIQKLNGLISVCKPCHNIKHFGLSQILAEQGKLDLDSLINHFMNVNSCSIEDFKAHKTEAFATWRERSQKQWTLDLGEYSEYVVIQ